MSAIISPCGKYRYRLERNVESLGPTFAYFGINGSIATADNDDNTVMRWRHFTGTHGGSRFVVGNVFAYRATDVRELGSVDDPVGDKNLMHLQAIIAEADVLVPCWGRRLKVPARLRKQFDVVEAMLVEAGKPLRCFGLTKCGNPKHPLRLADTTELLEWSPIR